MGRFCESLNRLNSPGARGNLAVRYSEETVMDLNTVQQIERAIDALTPEQREQLYLWLDEHYLQPSDIQLKAAIDAGRFDERIARAVADHRAGRTEPL
jgi:DNA-directed RNA polymerase specialized sigma24 family protein